VSDVRSDEAELVGSIEQITAASRRTWPFMLVGLLGILAGFGFLIVTIEQLRNDAAEQTRRWRDAAVQLEATLRSARDALDHRNPERAKALIDEAIRRTRDLAGNAPDAGPGPDDVAVDNLTPPAPDPTTNTPQMNTPEPAPTDANGQGTTSTTNTQPSDALPDPTPAPPPPPQRSQLVNNTNMLVRCAQAAANRADERTVRPLQPGERRPIEPGYYSCRSAAGTRSFAVGRSGLERITLLIDDAELVYRSQPLTGADRSADQM